MITLKLKNDTVKTEEVRTPKKKKAPPANQFYSPSKRKAGFIRKWNFFSIQAPEAMFI